MKIPVSGGWKETGDVDLAQRRAAAEAVAAVQADLGLPTVHVRWFQLDLAAAWIIGGPDIALAVLGAPPFDPTLMGKAVPHLVPPVLWIRNDLAPAEAGAVIA